MGKAKSLNNSGKFILRTDLRANSRGEYPLYVQYTLDRKVAKGECEVSVKEEDWNEQKQVVRASNSSYRILNSRLADKKRKVDNDIYEYSKTGKRITIDVLREIVQGTYDPNRQSKIDFVEYVEQDLVRRYKLEKIGVSVKDNGICAMGKFREFLRETTGEDSIFLSEVTSEMVDDYILWRKGKGNQNETINHALTPIIHACESAAQQQLISFQLAAIMKGKYLPIKKRLSEEDLDDNDVHYLTEEQLKQFVEMWDVVKHPRTRDYMDMFLFSFHSCGLRFSDILTLQWSNISIESEDKGTIRKILYKGDVNHTVHIRKPAIDILKRWKKKGGKRFVFGLLDDDFDLSNREELKRQRINRNTPIKTSLKALGDKMELPFNLTMHVARHTFAVLALNRGVDVHKVSVMMAHSSVTVTEQVYAKFMPSTIEAEIDSKLNFDTLI